MKRFTETAKWDDPWFRALAGANKLVFLYVIDRCNNAGFWEVDEAALVFHTRLDPKHIEGAWKALDRGLKAASGWVWVKNFLRHQKNDSLNPENTFHRQIIGLLREQIERFKDFPEVLEFLPKEAPCKGLTSPIGTGIGKGKKGSAEGKPKDREQAYDYGDEIGMPKADVDGWFDHFESNGWRVGGKAPMKDWKSALRNGKRRAPEFRTNGHSEKSEKSVTPDPAGWPEWLASKNFDYTEHSRALPNWRKAFADKI